MSDFMPIPDHPDYSISARGEVRSKLGVRLRVDEFGRVSLRGPDGHRRKIYLGDCLREAGFFVSAQDKEALARAEEALRDTLKRLALAEDERDQALGNMAARNAEGSAKALVEAEEARKHLREAQRQIAELNGRLSHAKTEGKKLDADLGKARKANALLLGIRATQERRIAALEKAAKASAPAPRRGRRARKAKTADEAEAEKI
jgi:hypothetical protein